MGVDRFRNQIAWKRTSAHSDTSRFGSNTDYLLYYTKSENYIWNPQYEEYDEKYLSRFRREDENGRKWTDGPLTAKGLSGGGYHYEYKGVSGFWRCPIETMKRLDKEGKLYFTNNNGIRVKKYLDEAKGIPLQTTWVDIYPTNSQAIERTNYPTQKPEELIERIIQTSTNKTSVVLDCFCGSGTTQASAQKLGRRWIGCDINKGAIQTTSKRLQKCITNLKDDTPLLSNSENNTFSFGHYRINNYDLQIQHNEFKELVYELAGITKLKTDSFFDGLLGNELVRIIPFNHPLTMLDIQLVKDELKKRPNEERNIVLVSLGKEVQIEKELEAYNKTHPINKMRVIELRTDKKYGAFFEHSPAQADVSVKRDGSMCVVKLNEFVSPTILQRLQIDSTLFQAKIKDFRSQIDVVLIDSNYDGNTFNIHISDVPEKKNDLVAGEYKFKLPGKDSKVAIKIIDMLGEEVLVVD
jgi:adenine-specific DNA-methyltransferase